LFGGLKFAGIVGMSGRGVIVRFVVFREIDRWHHELISGGLMT